MPNKKYYTLVSLLFSINFAYAQVDTNSSSYGAGKIVGYAFIALFLALIVRKLLKKD